LVCPDRGEFGSIGFFNCSLLGLQTLLGLSLFLLLLDRDLVLVLLDGILGLILPELELGLQHVEHAAMDLD
jgi:hypothetical protein